MAGTVKNRHNHLFGPVPSRRLGMSLGIDLIPHKVCTMNCVYCECGETTNLTTERREYVPVDSVLSELSRFLTKNPKPDYFTFSGSGEPTLNSRIGEVVRYLKQKEPKVPVAVLTNGSLLSDPQVRAELMPADVVLPSLDAVDANVFRRIDRPAKEVDLERYIEGLTTFTREFDGETWLEVMVIPGYNDANEHLNRLGEVIRMIGPTRIQLNALDRPGTVSELAPAPTSFLQEIIDTWNLSGIEIIASPAKRKSARSYGEDTERMILQTIARRPCTVSDLAEISGLHPNELNKYLSVLEETGRIDHVRRKRGVFYRTAEHR